MKRHTTTTEELALEQKVELAKNSKDPEVLKCLSYGDTDSVKSEVFKDDNTSKDVVNRLSKEFMNSSDPLIRITMTTYANHPKVLARLAESENNETRQCVADNLNTSSEILSKLADDKDEYVRLYVAGNPNTDPKTLAKLANDEATNVRQFVAKNKNTDLETSV